MTNEFRGWVRPRPLRIAFLIEENEHAHLMLDGIFANCHGRWGGRYSLIVPCKSAAIPDNYWAWLTEFDPDVVYSYVPLSSARVLEIHERLGPSEYYYHEQRGRKPRLDVFGFKPTLAFEPLSSLSTIFRLSRHAVAPGSPLKIIDSWYSEAPTRFFTDNFGTYHYTRATSLYPRDARAAATLLTVITPRDGKDRLRAPDDLETVPDETTAFGAFIERRATSLSLLSANSAPKLEVRSPRWSGAFNLVIGDSYDDRLLFWNARQLIPAWLDSELSCFRVSPTQLEDHGFVEQLAKLLNTRNHVNGGSGGQSQLVVRSASLTDDQLEAVVSSLKAHNTWGVARREKVLSLDELIPSAEDLASAHDGSRFGDTWARQPDWVEFNWTAPRARPPLCAPDHLVDAPARQTFIEGGWMSDFAFQFDGPRIRLSEENRWVLPKRWRMAGAFGVARAGAQRSAPPARRSRSGDLALFVTDSVPVAEVKIPTSTEAFNYALAYDGAWVKAGEENGSALPTNKVAWIRPSNEARYLIGVLGLLDGVHKAGQLLLHPFMRDIFTQLGGTPSVSSAATIPTANRLAKRARLQPSFDLKDGAEREALSILISQAARSTRASKDYLSLSGIMNGWEAYRKEWWAANPQQGDGDDAIDWDDHERRSLEDCLIAMRAQQVVFQGHQWVCTHCHHRNWVDMSELRTKLSCSVCQTATDAPVDTKWLFRPNEFLIESLRDHSALSLIWVLASLADRARRSLIYAEPTWLGYDHDHDEPDAEADLFAVLDGRAFLCEVKSSWGSLRAADIVKLVALARRLRPDAVLLAIMENGNKFQSEIADAKTDLATVGIDFELLTPKLRSPEDGPYLYFG